MSVKWPVIGEHHHIDHANNWHSVPRNRDYRRIYKVSIVIFISSILKSWYTTQSPIAPTVTSYIQKLYPAYISGQPICTPLSAFVQLSLLFLCSAHRRLSKFHQNFTFWNHSSRLPSRESLFTLVSNPLASERDAHKESPAQSRFPSNSYKYGYVYPTPMSRPVYDEWTVLTGLVIAPPKQKAQKMSIGTFLADESKWEKKKKKVSRETEWDRMSVLTILALGSWADEMDDLPLPGKSHPQRCIEMWW